MCPCCRPVPRYKRYIQMLFPKKQDEPMNTSAQIKLQYYAGTTPDKLPRIGRALEKKVLFDISKKRWGFVRIGIKSLTEIMRICHDNIALFIRHLFTMVHAAFRTGEHELHILGSETLREICRYVVDISHIRLLDSFVPKLCSMCLEDSKSVTELLRMRVRKEGLLTLQVFSGVLRADFIVFFEDVIPAVMSNVALTEPVNEEGVRVEEGENAGVVVQDILKGKDEGEEEKDDANESISSMRTNLRYTATECLRKFAQMCTMSTMTGLLSPLFRHLDRMDLWKRSGVVDSAFFTILNGFRPEYGYPLVTHLLLHADSLHYSQHMRLVFQLCARLIESLRSTPVARSNEVYAHIVRHLLKNERKCELLCSESAEREEILHQPLELVIGKFVEVDDKGIVEEEEGEEEEQGEGEKQRMNTEEVEMTIVRRTLLLCLKRVAEKEANHAHNLSFVTLLLGYIEEAVSSRIREVILHACLHVLDNPSTLSLGKHVPENFFTVLLALIVDAGTDQILRELSLRVINEVLTSIEKGREDSEAPDYNPSVLRASQLESILTAIIRVMIIPDNIPTLFNSCFQLLLHLMAMELESTVEHCIPMLFRIQDMCLSDSKNEIGIIRVRIIMQMILAFLVNVGEALSIPSLQNYVREILEKRRKSGIIPDFINIDDGMGFCVEDSVDLDAVQIPSAESLFPINREFVVRSILQCKEFVDVIGHEQNLEEKLMMRLDDQDFAAGFGDMESLPWQFADQALSSISDTDTLDSLDSKDLAHFSSGKRKSSYYATPALARPFTQGGGILEMLHDFDKTARGMVKEAEGVAVQLEKVARIGLDESELDDILVQMKGHGIFDSAQKTGVDEWRNFLSPESIVHVMFPHQREKVVAGSNEK
eukprot:TRINITY_DN7352_c0_g2_i1.p1 TRINITY_DN7352_c0_g2~~TRINITY_DN7352_c0_g2_i1.p1  ORF type:complete len:881 (+),score=226.30 TRINITY_DN7352_c0_g2_i1:82-2724(+)